MNDIEKQKKKKMAETHCKQMDILICQIFDELDETGEYEITPELINEAYILAFQKWEFLNKYQFINNEKPS